MIKNAAEARRLLILKLGREKKDRNKAWYQTPEGREATKSKEVRRLYSLPGIKGRDLPNDAPDEMPRTFPKHRWTRERRLLQLQGMLPEQVELRVRAQRIADAYSRPLLTVHEVLGPWTIGQIAHGTGLPRPTISKCLRGMKRVSVDVLLRLSLFLDLDPISLASFCNYQRIAYLKWGARKMARPLANRLIR